MEVLAYDPYLPDGSATGPAQLVATLDELLERSSTVSLHCPLTEATRGLLGRRELDLLGPDGVLVVTPHVAGITRAGNDRVSRAVAEGVLTALRGGRPPVVANPEVYRKS